MFTIQAVWDDSLAFMRRERALLVPLALATLGLGNMVIAMAQAEPSANPADPTALALQVLVLLAAIWMAIGKLGLITLALRSHCSVGEALRHGGARLGIYLITALMIGVIFGLLFAPVVPQFAPYLTQLQHNDFTHIHLARWARLWIAVVAIFVMYVSTRLFVLEAVVVDRKGNPLELLKQSFQATRGVFWRLLLFTLGFSVFALILAAAVAASFGTLFAILGKLIDTPFTGKVLEALVQSVLTAGLGMIEAVFTAKAYQRLTGATTMASIFK